MTQSITIAIIDEYPIFRKGLSIFLREHFNNVTVTESNTVDSFITERIKNTADIIILGINQVNKKEKAKEFKRLKSQLGLGNVIVYEDELHLETISHYLRAGVQGYLLKQNSLPDLICCIEDVLSGKRYLCNESISWLVEDRLGLHNKRY